MVKVQSVSEWKNVSCKCLPCCQMFLLATFAELFFENGGNRSPIKSGHRFRRGHHVSRTAARTLIGCYTAVLYVKHCVVGGRFLTKHLLYD